MAIVSAEQLRVSGETVFRSGRLLERQLFDFLFGRGSREACVKALVAYQNPDGGFGNGLEPDLLCPDSSAIGAETALFVLDLLDYRGAEVLEPLVGWIVRNQTETGEIPHPPAGLFDYPHQPWWKNRDEDRALALAGLLKRWDLAPAGFLERARQVYLRTEPPAPDAFYGYPTFVYLKSCREGEEDEARFARMVEALPVLLDRCADHFPLFSRGWYHAADCVAPDVLEANARAFAAALQPDGFAVSPYPDLPWWLPIMTLDGLALMRRFGWV